MSKKMVCFDPDKNISIHVKTQTLKIEAIGSKDDLVYFVIALEEELLNLQAIEKEKLSRLEHDS